MIKTRPRPNHVAPELADNHLFAGCTPDELETISRLVSRVHVPQGTKIIRQGMPSRQFFIIVSGTVQISRTTTDGEPQTAYLGTGDFFGETGLLNRTSRAASATAATDVELYVATAAEFRQMVTASRLFALHVRLASRGARAPATAI